MKVLKISENAVQKIKESIEKEKLVVLPADTVYSLICDVTNEKAAKEIFKIKKEIF